MPKVTKEDGRDILKHTIRKDIRHTDYVRVCEIAERYAGYATGKGIALKRFVPSESEELFKQREQITSLITPDISNTLATPMYKVGRTTPNESIAWGNTEAQEKNRKELMEIASKFYGDQSVTDYLTTRMVDLDRIDPNSFIVVEFEGEVDPANKESKANPYPFEVNSKEAINYKYVNNQLQWLIVLNGTEDRFTMYLDNEAILARLVHKDNLNAELLKTPTAEVFYKDEENKENSLIFLITEVQHKAGRIPARRVGTIKDPVTRNRTCVPIIHPADAYFQKSIKTVSEFDLTNALHAFPKVFRYGDPCRGAVERGIICNDGKTADDSKCPICKGSGWSAQTTTATEVIVRAPKDLKEMVNLENMMAYKAPNADLLKFQKDYGLYELKECAIKAVYNSDTYVSDSVAKTATEAGLDFEAVYDTLKPFADSWSQMKVHIMMIIAAYRDLSKDLTYTHNFPKDFKMKPLSVLLADLKAAADSGAPSYIKKSINHDIAKKVYVDQPDELIRIQTKEIYFPFNGKGVDEINYILANGLKSKFDRVLYASFDQIFDEIEAEQSEKNVDFYKMPGTKQKDLIKKKVQEYISLIDAEESASSASAFGSGLGGDAGDDVNQPGDDLGKIPLAIQQLALARTRAEESGDTALAAQIGSKIDELLMKI